MNQVIRIKMFDEKRKIHLSGNEITQSTVKSLFLLPNDAIVRLLYEMNGDAFGCNTRNTPEPCFLLPDGWPDIEFVLESAKAPLHPASPLGTQGEVAPTYVAVKDNEEGYLVKLRCNPDNTLSEKTFKCSFPNATELKFDDPTGASQAVNLDPSGKLFLCPAGGWKGRVFTAIISPPVVERLVEEWKDRVFYVTGKNLVGAGVLVHGKRIFTAAHLGFTLNDTYTVCGTNGRRFSAKCRFILNAIDFTVLQSDDFEERPFFGWEFSLGRNYYVLGYPDSLDRSSPKVVSVSIVEEADWDRPYYVGTTGAGAGYFGGPVVHGCGGLCGILLRLNDGRDGSKLVRLESMGPLLAVTGAVSNTES